MVQRYPAKRLTFIFVSLIAIGGIYQTHVSVLNLPRTLEETKLESFASNDQNTKYLPASVETYLVQNAVTLGYHADGAQKGCQIWKEQEASSPVIHSQLQLFLKDLDEYTTRVQEFKPKILDLRTQINENNRDEICRTVDLHDDGLMALFGRSQQLSLTSAGYVEPLLPPMRHPSFCEIGYRRLLDLNYMVHDFGAMCRSLKPTSRVVLFDIGASLQFHGKRGSPAIYLTDLYERFGFPFDHIYAFEIKKKDPAEVFQLLPSNLLSAYHWINVGVSSEPDHPLNPFTILKQKFNKDDLIIVKLDIDTPSVEMPLVRQLLGDDELIELVDQFYFEHHVKLAEMKPYWGEQVEGTVQDSLDLFHTLRQKGVAAHFWV